MDLTRYFKKIYLCKSEDFTQLKSSDFMFDSYPYLVSKTDCSNQRSGWLVSAVHGRSVIVSASEEEYVILKGAGLTYTSKQYINISEYKYNHIWGHFSKEGCLKEFKLGSMFSKLGGVGPKYEGVFRINDFTQEKLVGLKKITPYLLQYRVRCPIRVSDLGLFDKKVIKEYLSRNNAVYGNTFHLYFAKNCIHNLLTLHNHSFFYNSLNIYNTTLLGEFVDFESSFTKECFCPDEGFSEYESLMAREIINLLQVIAVFADVLGEEVRVKELNAIIECDYWNQVESPSIRKYRYKFHQLIRG